LQIIRQAQFFIQENATVQRRLGRLPGGSKEDKVQIPDEESVSYTAGNKLEKKNPNRKCRRGKEGETEERDLGLSPVSAKFYFSRRRDMKTKC